MVIVICNNFWSLGCSDKYPLVKLNKIDPLILPLYVQYAQYKKVKIPFQHFAQTKAKQPPLICAFLQSEKISNFLHFSIDKLK